PALSATLPDDVLPPRAPRRLPGLSRLPGPGLRRHRQGGKNALDQAAAILTRLAKSMEGRRGNEARAWRREGEGRGRGAREGERGGGGGVRGGQRGGRRGRDGGAGGGAGGEHGDGRCARARLTRRRPASVAALAARASSLPSRTCSRPASRRRLRRQRRE